MAERFDHPEIVWAERTGYPSWKQEKDECEFDEDAAYEERRDMRRGINETQEE